MEKGHEDFRKRLKDHIIENYNDQYLAAQAASAMIAEYNRSYPDDFEVLNTLAETMREWRKAKENYNILDVEYAHHILAMRINIVQRLSDGEWFSLSDKLNIGTEVSVITKMIEGEFGLELHFNTNNLRDVHILLENAVKYKEPKKEYEVLRTDGILCTNGMTPNVTKIKRLSDGELFKIGDLCYPKNRPLNCGSITKFEYCDAGYFRIESEGKYYLNLDSLVKSKKEYETITQYQNDYAEPIVVRVQRLSDNETFTVGDHILEGEIKAIRILDNGTCYLKDEDWFVELKDAQKYIAPPFEFWRTREEQIKGCPIIDDSSINEQPELTPTCEGFWKQFEVLTNDPDFIAERNVLLGFGFTKENMIEFGAFCQMYQSRIRTNDIFKAWNENRG